MSRPRTSVVLATAAAVLLAVAAVMLHVTGYSAPLRARLTGGRTVADRLAEFGPAVAGRLTPSFAAAGVDYPPGRVVFVGLKAERRLDVYAAAAADGHPVFIRSYPILAASGVAGPKLREGDHQVPEGVYRVESLNPNSRFHAAIRVGYPGPFDRAMAARDGRTALGGDIMIHGSDKSVGCLAMGDGAAEDLFALAALAGIENVEVILTPHDLRTAPPPPLDLPWANELYRPLVDRLRVLPPPAANGRAGSGFAPDG